MIIQIGRETHVYSSYAFLLGRNPSWISGDIWICGQSFQFKYFITIQYWFPYELKMAILIPLLLVFVVVQQIPIEVISTVASHKGLQLHFDEIILFILSKSDISYI
jgi:hypothetical protein